MMILLWRIHLYPKVKKPIIELFQATIRLFRLTQCNSQLLSGLMLSILSPIMSIKSTYVRKKTNPKASMQEDVARFYKGKFPPEREDVELGIERDAYKARNSPKASTFRYSLLVGQKVKSYSFIKITVGKSIENIDFESLSSLERESEEVTEREG
ncbi:hypothetical protein CFOL_v3_13178, partial [Cephalotus follicularis]